MLNTTIHNTHFEEQSVAMRFHCFLIKRNQFENMRLCGIQRADYGFILLKKNTGKRWLAWYFLSPRLKKAIGQNPLLVLWVSASTDLVDFPNM